MSHFRSRASTSRPRDSRHSLLPAHCLPTPRNQSLHFANRNRSNSMKTRSAKKFNRYTLGQFERRNLKLLRVAGCRGHCCGGVVARVIVGHEFLLVVG